MQEAVCVTTLVVDPLCGDYITRLISKISVGFEVSEFRLQVLEIGRHTHFTICGGALGSLQNTVFVFNPLMVQGWV